MRRAVIRRARVNMLIVGMKNGILVTTWARWAFCQSSFSGTDTMIRAAILPGLIAAAFSFALPAHGAEPGTRAAVADFNTCAKPEWPKEALRKEQTGKVTLAFLIGADGQVKDSKLKASSGFPLLDEAAMNGVMRCKFKPALRGGEPVEAWMQMQYVWTLEGSPAPVNIAALTEAANSGDAEAQNNLGLAYEYGRGVKRDAAEAAQWYRKAALNGHAWGQNNLGLAYASGRGVERNDAEANVWLGKAAEQGLAAAQVRLGFRLINGIGAPRDEVTATAWYRKAADQGDPMGQNNLGYSYELGTGVARDYAEALRLYRLAAARGNAYAEEALGNLYDNGLGVAADMPTALAWYYKAAAKNNPPGLRKLGMLHEAGRGVEKNPAIALGYFERAAADGDQAAMRRLAKAYGAGELGLAPDAAIAKQWQERAERVYATVNR
jgi:TonB family protein